uniref:Putative gut cathepsin L-like cysteine protease n=1 Tax=Callosobruchus maculatus TaxID=64391 RepID=Q717S5_CALMS|nr:putative gut cathepsin L-like cysteine protease [Callosobruchus maculatus]
MKFLVVVATLVLVAGASSVYEEWQQFKLDHGKTYRSLVEEKRRFSVFQKNLVDIQEHNKKYERGEESFAKKVTQFADMTHEEFLDLLKLQGVPALPSNAVHFDNFEDIDMEEKDAIDWREEGAVTPVKDQANCGSCWAFSAVGAIEGQFFKKNGTLVSLSAQELVDCATEDYGNNGCKGGLMGQAFDFVQDEGIQTEESYPYEGRRSSCKKSGEYVTKVKTYVFPLDEQEMARTVAAKGPVAVAIEASQLSFYDKGIVDERCRCSNKREDLNHGVLVVGYGSENGVDYWIVKNSWGADWGEKGYFRLKKDVKACGIGTYNTYPVLL